MDGRYLAVPAYQDDREELQATARSASEAVSVSGNAGGAPPPDPPREQDTDYVPPRPRPEQPVNPYPEYTPSPIAPAQDSISTPSQTARTHVPAAAAASCTTADPIQVQPWTGTGVPATETFTPVGVQSSVPVTVGITAYQPLALASQSVIRGSLALINSPAMSPTGSPRGIPQIRPITDAAVGSPRVSEPLVVIQPAISPDMVEAGILQEMNPTLRQIAQAISQENPVQRRRSLEDEDRPRHDDQSQADGDGSKSVSDLAQGASELSLSTDQSAETDKDAQMETEQDSDSSDSTK